MEKQQEVTLKAWYAYEGSRDWLSAMLVVENGAVAASHICSATCFIPGDLWEARKERREKFAAAGITLDIQNNGEPLHAKDLPPELLARNKSNAEAIDAFYKRINPEYAKVEGVFSTESAPTQDGAK